MSLAFKIEKISRPVWKYLNQPLFNSSSVWTLNRFWYLYKIEMLERCLEYDTSYQSQYPH